MERLNQNSEGEVSEKEANQKLQVSEDESKKEANNEGKSQEHRELSRKLRRPPVREQGLSRTMP